MRERAALVREKFNLPSFGYTTLRDYYLREKVRYRKPQFSYAEKDRNLRVISDQQQLFSKALSRILIEDKEEVIYIDETSFHLWQQPSKCWVTRDMTLSLPTMRGKSLTMIGAISEKRGMIHYELFAGSNTAQTFSNFLTKLKLKCRYPAVVVQDNLSVHKARIVMDVYGG